MEFPRHVHQPNGRYVIVTTEAEYDEMQALGWADQAPAHVEQPVEVTLYHARLADGAPAEAKRQALPEASVADLSVEDAKAVIASADAVQLAAIEDEEVAGKNRKGILALIEVRKADLLDD